MQTIIQSIASELSVQTSQVQAAVDLLDGGATVPFIARYRKEATGGLDDIQLRELQTRLGYLRELHERRAAILKSIAEQGKLTPELQAAIAAAVAGACRSAAGAGMIEAAVDHDRRVISCRVALRCVSANVCFYDVGEASPDVACGKGAQIGFCAASVWLSIDA